MDRHDRKGGPPGPKPPGKPFNSRPGKDRPRRSAPTERTSAHEGERIAKVMARAGLCSRRDAEDWIRAGRVAVNGRAINDPALNVTARDQVSVDGKPLAAPERTRMWLFNKPRGLVTTESDPENRPTVFGYLAHHHPELPRVVSVGRLDINTEGLLLLTNDGGLARVLELPATGWLRRYRVRAHGEITPDRLLTLKEGVTIEGVDYAPIEATLDRVQGSNVWITMGLREGKNREVRRVLEHLGLGVNRLIRLSYGPFQLGEAPEGAAEEVRTRVLIDQLGEALIAQAGADFSSPAAAERRSRGPRRDAMEETPPPRRDRPVAPKRKHVSALRAERDERAAGERLRVERGATQDRRGRAVTVERVTPARPKPEAPATRNARRFRDEREPRREERPRSATGPRGSRRFDDGGQRPGSGPRRGASKRDGGGDRPRSFSAERSSPSRSGPDRSGPDRSGPSRSGPPRSGPPRPGPSRPGHGRPGSGPRKPRDRG